MKYALTLLFILILGFFASQAIVKPLPAHGYETNIKDTILLQNIYNKIDVFREKNPQKLKQIIKKFPSLFTLFPTDSKEIYILQKIYQYMLSFDVSTTVQNIPTTPSTNNKRSSAMLHSLLEEIDEKN